MSNNLSKAIVVNLFWGILIMMGLFIHILKRLLLLPDKKGLFLGWHYCGTSMV
ncbi:MAG: hypothetical protein RIA69_11785 [Cyclobacteriaceae bacterium]